MLMERALPKVDQSLSQKGMWRNRIGLSIALLGVSVSSVVAAMPRSDKDRSPEVCGLENQYVFNTFSPDPPYYEGDSEGHSAHLRSFHTKDEFGDRSIRPENLTEENLGSLWGVAYDSERDTLYASAFFKRGVGFGPAGPGGIYAVDRETGEATGFARLPAGPDGHSWSSIRAGTIDDRNMDRVGKTSLGDLDVAPDGTVFVANIFDDSIYRLSPEGRTLDVFPHGAVGETWVDEAHVFGVDIGPDRKTLYHAVTYSAQEGSDGPTPRAHVYASQLDGTDMKELYAVNLDYERGIAHLDGTYDPTREFKETSIVWGAWTSDLRTATKGATFAIAPQPMAVDIATFSGEDERHVISLNDRAPHMDWRVDPDASGASAFKPLLPAGGYITVSQSDDGSWAADTFPGGYPLDEYADTTPLYTFLSHEGIISGIAEVSKGTPSATDFLVEDLNETGRGHWGTLFGWLDTSGHTITDLLSDRRSVEEGDEEYPPTGGDIVQVCVPPEPTPSPTATPSPSATHTVSPTPSPSATLTATSTPTRALLPIYLPIALRERCTPEIQRIDVALVIDASSSMREVTAGGRPKIDAALGAVRVFLAQLHMEDGDQAAIITFHRKADRLQALTADRAALDVALERIEIDMTTCIVCGVAAADEELSSPRRKSQNVPVLILLTDGRSNPRPISEAVAQAAQAKDRGVVVFAIGLGDDLDFEALANMASRPDFYHFAPDADGLEEIYRRIAVSIPCPAEAYWGGRR